MALSTIPSAQQAFISYSHVDSNHLDRFKKHLAMLRRDGLLRDWSDHEIIPGDALDRTIGTALDQSDLFLGLLSSDYLASPYCYETELKRALELQTAGRMRIVGIVIEPCDWKSSPFGRLLTLPKDGKAVSEWQNEDTAWVNVVQEIRRTLTHESSTAISWLGRAKLEQSTREPIFNTNDDSLTSSSSRFKIRRDFDTIEKSEFADQAFTAVRDHFERGCNELPKLSDQIRCRFTMMNSAAFTCTIVNQGKSRGQDGHITVRRSRGRMSIGDISFVYAEHADDGSSNGWLSVSSDNYEMFLSGSTAGFGRSDDRRWTAEGAAASLWKAFVSQVGVELE